MENFLLHSFILPGWEILEMLRCYGCLLLRGTNQYNQYFFVIAFSVHQIYIYIYIYIYITYSASIDAQRQMLLICVWSMHHDMFVQCSTCMHNEQAIICKH